MVEMRALTFMATIGNVYKEVKDSDILVGSRSSKQREKGKQLIIIIHNITHTPA